MWRKDCRVTPPTPRRCPFKSAWTFIHKASVGPAFFLVAIQRQVPGKRSPPFPERDARRDPPSSARVQGELGPTRPQTAAVERSRCEARSPCAAAAQHAPPTRSRQPEYAGPISFSRNCARCVGRRRSSLHQPVCYSLTNF